MVSGSVIGNECFLEEALSMGVPVFGVGIFGSGGHSVCLDVLAKNIGINVPLATNGEFNSDILRFGTPKYKQNPLVN